MAYATLAQLNDRYGLRELSELLCDEARLVTEELLHAKIAGDISDWSADEQTAINTAAARVDTALTQQSTFIDSQIGNIYQLPLANAGSLSVVECCTALTRAALADDGDNISTTIKEERNHWRGWLKMIAKSDAVLPGEVRIGENGQASKRLQGTMKSTVDWSRF